MHTYRMMCQTFKLQFRDSTAILCIKQLFFPGAAVKSILMSWVRRGPNKPSCCFDFKPVFQSFRCFDVSFFLFDPDLIFPGGALPWFGRLSACPRNPPALDNFSPLTLWHSAAYNTLAGSSKLITSLMDGKYVGQMNI